MKINHRCTFALRFLIILFVLFFNISTLMAVAFPFRQFNLGEQVPDVTLYPFQENQEVITFSEFKGRPFMAVFWGADLPEKIEHSAKVLAEIETLTPFLKERNIRRLSVNVQNDDSEAIKEVLNTSGSTIDVYLDKNQKAYAELGIFVMPTILLVDKEGNAAAGMGYSRDLIDRLKGEIEIMLGEKTPEQVAAELRPEMKETAEEVKTGRRHFDFGMVMLQRGQIDAAIREFGKAIEVDPALSEAYLQLGCLYLDRNELDSAEGAINKALETDPDSVDGRICRGELLRLKGELDKAVAELQAIIRSHPDRYKAYYYLARVFEDQQKTKEAMEMYKQGYKAILKHSVAEE